MFENTARLRLEWFSPEHPRLWYYGCNTFVRSAGNAICGSGIRSKTQLGYASYVFRPNTFAYGITVATPLLGLQVMQFVARVFVRKHSSAAPRMVFA